MMNICLKVQNYINGNWSNSTKTFATTSPEDGSVLGNAPLSSESDVNRAVEAAAAAFSTWSRTTVKERAGYLSEAAGWLIEKGKNLLPGLITLEMGKRLPEAKIEVIESSDVLRFFADKGPHFFNDRPIALNKSIFPGKRSSLIFQPVGVVGIIKPWNYPLELPLWAIGAALASGNTVIFKPSEYTPIVGNKIAEMFHEVKLPEGVFNLVNGNGSTGELLARHSNVDMISFTGSRENGYRVSRICSERFCKVSLELAGKDAMIVLEDADLDLAVNGAVWGAFTNCGQVCVGVRRLLIPGKLKENFLQKMVLKTKKLRLGKDIGPLANENQLEKVCAHVQNAVKLGARVLYGGKRPEGKEFSKGYFYLPTILENTKPEMLVEKEDTFGPVVFVKEFSEIEEAIDITNSVIYDLGVSIWTQDIGKGLNIARRIKTGMVWINDVNVAFPEAPWGGIRWSGHGIELSEFSFLNYSNLRHINWDIGKEKRRDWWFPY
jgi:acyl-CoA reductase-like NAD-dependent aldehyde dehydrogenase